MDGDYYNYFTKREGEAKITYVKPLGSGGFAEVYEVILHLLTCTECADARRRKSTSNNSARFLISSALCQKINSAFQWCDYA
jgi:hypothetical protein